MDEFMTVKEQQTRTELAKLQMQVDFFYNQLITETEPKERAMLEKKIAKLKKKMQKLQAPSALKASPSETGDDYAKLKKYRSWLIICLILILLLTSLCVITLRNYSQLKISYRSANYLAEYYRDKNEILEERLADATGKKPVTPTPEPFDTPSPTPSSTPVPTVTPTSTPGAETTLYYVRKSASDKNSQLGAFSVFENAKKLADANKSDGYKVFDDDGNCVYTP